MTDKPTFAEYIDYHYKSKGGYRVLKEVLGSAAYDYEMKITETKRIFQISRATVNRYYAKFRAYEGLK